MAKFIKATNICIAVISAVSIAGCGGTNGSVQHSVRESDSTASSEAGSYASEIDEAAEQVTASESADEAATIDQDLLAAQVAFGDDTDEFVEDGDVVSFSFPGEFDSWAAGYKRLLETAFEDYGYDYALIYLDEDDVPELWIDTNVEASGEHVATYHEGTVRVMHLSRTGSDFIPGRGLIYNNCGHMDWYPVYIYHLVDGQFIQLRSGIWGGLDWKNGMEFTEDGGPDYQYEWAGIRYDSEEAFYDKIREDFDIDAGVRPESWLDRAEIMQELSGETTGSGSSQDTDFSQYALEFSMEDVTTTDGVLVIDQQDSSIDGLFMYGEAFSIEKKIGDHWEELTPREDMAFIEIAISVENGKINKHPYSWKEMYGALDAGDYRFKTDIVCSVGEESSVRTAYVPFCIQN